MKILILISGGAQIRRHICIVDLYRWLNENNKKQQGYCSVGYAIRQYKISGSVIRKTFLLIQTINLLFADKKRATFDAKVARLRLENDRLTV